ncbi:MAG: response regulator transcription factor [Lachnospiraceae bacterium]|nr:response regulator transcription factor [Lachnospiraceae bacterium]
MKIAVCDDSSKDRESLIRLLREYEQSKGKEFEIAEYDCGEALLENSAYLQSCQIVFMDINMNHLSGLEAAAAIKNLYPPILIVLVTAYIDYALDGYKVRASRFLVKDDLSISITECMDALVGEIEQETRTIEFPFVEGKIRLKINDIIYIETARHKNVFYTKEGSYNIYKKLDEIEKELRDFGFVRIHQSFLVNMRYVRKISSYVLTLMTGKEISVPKARYAEVKKQYTLYKGVE